MNYKRIVIIGASSANGKIDVDGGGFVGRLKSWHETKDKYKYNTVFNLGIAGDRTDSILKRAKAEIPPRRPNLIIIQTGTNDMMRPDSVENPTSIDIVQSEANIEGLIRFCKEICEVIVVSIWPTIENKTIPAKKTTSKLHFLDNIDLEKLHSVTKKICKDEEIAYIDIWQNWNKPEVLEKYLATDGLHANTEGHKNIAERIIQKISN